MAITMILPAGIQQVNGKYGNSYVPDANNYITNVKADDVNALLAYGAVFALPSPASAYFGGGTAFFREEGNISPQIVSAGISPGGTGADNVMAMYSIPANSFNLAGAGVMIMAQGSFAANAHTKQIKIIVNPATAVVGSTVGTGGTTVADTGAVVTNGGGWSLAANVYKYGALNSNTQIGLHQQAQVGAAVAALLAPSLITATENGAILVAVTGNCTTTAADVVLNFLLITASN